MNEDQIKAHIESTFRANPKAPYLFVTSDGQCFLPNAKTYAFMHSGSLPDKRIAKVTQADLDKLDLEQDYKAGEQELAEQKEKEEEARFGTKKKQAFRPKDPDSKIIKISPVVEMTKEPKPTEPEPEGAGEKESK